MTEDLVQLRNWFQLAPVVMDSSPLYGALGPVLAESNRVMELVAQRRPGQQPTNLFFAAMHAVVLAGADHPLRDYFASVGGCRPPDAELGAVALDFCDAFADELLPLVRTRLVQTNVVKRSAALQVGLAAIAGLTDSPLHLVEVGASAGVHLRSDRYRYRLGGAQFGDGPVEIDCEWRSDSPPPPLLSARVESAFGIDLHPVDVRNAADRDWLRALVWPENSDELALLEQALAVVAADPPTILEGDIVERWPEVDAELPRGEPRVVFHAAVRGHVPEERRPAFDDAIAALGRNGPLYWLSLEGPLFPDDRIDPYAVQHVLGLRTSGEPGGVHLALVEQHGEWIKPLRV